MAWALVIWVQRHASRSLPVAKCPTLIFLLTAFGALAIHHLIQMKKVWEFLGSTLGFLFSAGIIYLWIAGSLHAQRKHDEGYLPWAVFPWGMYRGAEQFWHNDYANVDWDKRLANDLNSCIYLLTDGSSRNGDKVSVNEGIEDMSNKISHYPADKKTFLMNGCRTFIKYALSDTKELLEAGKRYYSTGEYKIIWSDSTLKYKNELVTVYKQGDIISTLDSMLKVQQSQMKSTPITDTTEVNRMTENFRKQTEMRIVESKMVMGQVFAKVFNQPL